MFAFQSENRCFEDGLAPLTGPEFGLGRHGGVE
jgi:hypothetical protein